MAEYAQWVMNDMIPLSMYAFAFIFLFILLYAIWYIWFVIHLFLMAKARFLEDCKELEYDLKFKKRFGGEDEQIL